MCVEKRAAEPDNILPRLIGRYGGQTPGPLVIAIGGIHGNEPAGVVALERVLARLQQKAGGFTGELIALRGNTRALSAGRRYLHRDLNRMWLPERVAEVKSQPAPVTGTPEELEQRELLEALETALARRTREAVFLDLHTTSSFGAPFVLVSDTLRNRFLAQQLQVPLILGLEESVEGTTLNYINDLGHTALGFEAGQHDAPSSVEHHEAALWLTLAAVGCVTAADVPDLAACRAKLSGAAQSLPTVFEVRYRHALRPDDDFVMKSGFTNFYPVDKAQNVAQDRQGAVLTREGGYLFMPLYQKQGEDGFFLIRPIRPFWLRVSAWLRRKRCDRVLHWLPGVRKLPAPADGLHINTKIARWFVLEICHLLGYRKYAQTGEELIILRRRQTSAQENTK